MSPIGRFAALLVVLAIAAPLAGCGKRPKLLDPPEGGNPDFPRTYPTSK